MSTGQNMCTVLLNPQYCLFDDKARWNCSGFDLGRHLVSKHVYFGEPP